jgi:hypothetical protein
MGLAWGDVVQVKVSDGQGMSPMSLKYSCSNAFLAVTRWLGSNINIFCSLSPHPSMSEVNYNIAFALKPLFLSTLSSPKTF